MCNLTNLVNNISNNFKKGQMLDTIIPFIKKYDNDDWKKYINFSNQKYVRNLIFRNDKFEIYLICWDKNQKSPIHDHSENGCVMNIISLKYIMMIWLTIMTYSYISFFDKWNWYIMYVLKGNSPITL